MTEFAIRAMTIADHSSVFALWSEIEGIVLTDTDEREPMQRFLGRNPRLRSCPFLASHFGPGKHGKKYEVDFGRLLGLVAEVDKALVGAVLCSHDGRRGYLHHLAVASDFRRQGLGSGLVQRCLSLLQREGIVKCNIFIPEDNESGTAFWEKIWAPFVS